jgi:hypothetical protein
MTYCILRVLRKCRVPRHQNRFIGNRVQSNVPHLDKVKPGWPAWEDVLRLPSSNGVTWLLRISPKSVCLNHTFSFPCLRLWSNQVNQVRAHTLYHTPVVLTTLSRIPKYSAMFELTGISDVPVTLSLHTMQSKGPVLIYPLTVFKWSVRECKYQRPAANSLCMILVQGYLTTDRLDRRSKRPWEGSSRKVRQYVVSRQ